jgi:hypothetical protein
MSLTGAAPLVCYLKSRRNTADPSKYTSLRLSFTQVALVDVKPLARLDTKPGRGVMQLTFGAGQFAQAEQGVFVSTSV